VEAIELVAATDSKERVRKGMQEKFGFPHVYADFLEMLEKEKLDLVSVCTWHLLHAEHTITAAEYFPQMK